MTTSRLPGLAGLIVSAAVMIAAAACSNVDNEVDLLSQIDTAEKRTNIETGPQFVLETVAIDNVSKRAVLARPASRLIYSITVPRDAWFEVAFAMKPETWDQPGDGAQFRVGVSDGRVYEELLKQYINPKRGDRRWFSARLDLSAYEGRQVKLILNTDPGPPQGRDRENDLAVWAEPRIYSKR
jgi:hypothetical protein